MYLARKMLLVIIITLRPNHTKAMEGDKGSKTHNELAELQA